MCAVATVDAPSECSAVYSRRHVCTIAVHQLSALRTAYTSETIIFLRHRVLPVQIYVGSLIGASHLIGLCLQMWCYAAVLPLTCCSLLPRNTLSKHQMLGRSLFETGNSQFYVTGFGQSTKLL